MSSAQLKLIAMATMVVDHVGVFLLPDVFFLRIIGRLSFILFAWLIANGARHTSNIYAYLKRLFFLALISQIPFFLLFREIAPGSLELNILFTLSLGLLAIIVVKNNINIFLKAALVIAIAVVAQIFCGDFSYGAYGVATILIFYIFSKDIRLTFFFQAFAIVVFFVIPMILREPSITHILGHGHVSSVQLFGLFSILLIALYKNKKEVNKYKLLFYAFYPAHLLVIYFISIFLD